MRTPVNEVQALLSRMPRLTIRARLTLTYAGLVTGCGAVLIAIVWIFMRFVPTYGIVATAGPASDDAVHFDSSSPAAGEPSTLGSDLGESVVARASGFNLVVNSAGSFLDVLLIVSTLALTLLAIVSGLIGWIVAGRVLKPLKAINAAATIAATGALDHRVGLEGPRDEIQDLSDTFDRMLGELERSFAAHRRFAANASHELRTPLATTQTMIDVALADPDASTVELRELARRIHHVNRANMQTVESLLDLADIGQRACTRTPVDLGPLIADTVDTAAEEARAREVTVAIHDESHAKRGPVIAAGDSVLIRRAVANLVQNAIRHNVPGGTADVYLEQREGTAIVVVCNTGEKVPDHTVESLAEPFVRGVGRAVGAHGNRGHGLGLAIAASIADAHGGTLRLAANTAGGLTAELTLNVCDNPLELPRSAGQFVHAEE